MVRRHGRSMNSARCSFPFGRLQATEEPQVVTTVRACVLGLILCLAAPSLAEAADETIVMRLGGTSILNLDSSFETVVIGDPDIVDIHTLDNRSVIVEPLKIGAANLIFVNASSIVTANIRVLVRGVSLTDGQRPTGAV